MTGTVTIGGLGAVTIATNTTTGAETTAMGGRKQGREPLAGGSADMQNRLGRWKLPAYMNGRSCGTDADRKSVV